MKPRCAKLRQSGKREVKKTKGTRTVVIGKLTIDVHTFVLACTGITSALLAQVVRVTGHRRVHGGEIERTH
jgi:hypothetical protein